MIRTLRKDISYLRIFRPSIPRKHSICGIVKVFPKAFKLNMIAQPIQVIPRGRGRGGVSAPSSAGCECSFVAARRARLDPPFILSFRDFPHLVPRSSVPEGSKASTVSCRGRFCRFRDEAMNVQIDFGHLEECGRSKEGQNFQG